jgi:hypothetical protein
MKKIYDYYPFSEKETGLNFKIMYGLIITNKKGIIHNKHLINPILQINNISDNWDLDDNCFFIEIKSKLNFEVLEGKNNLTEEDISMLKKWIEINYENLLTLTKKCIIGTNWMSAIKNFSEIKL